MSKAAASAPPTVPEDRQGGGGVGGQTARFTSSEKQILFDLFLEHQHIIDIKYRKNGRTKKKLMSVRECWEKIVDEYNANPATSTPRNMKQVQKFWLNARLRKKYPFSSNAYPAAQPGSERPTSTPKTSIKQESLETVENENLNSSIEDGRTNDFISIDQISADKLTLNDLLDFKNARPVREEVFIIRDNPSTTEKQDSNPEPAPHSTPLPSSVKTPSVESDHEDLTHETIVKDFDDRLNFFKLREAELRCKEQEILLQQKKLELIRMRTEIKNMKELHQLQVESMKIKLRILSAEEKSIKNKKDIS